jgi:hypothetical protein
MNIPALPPPRLWPVIASAVLALKADDALQTLLGATPQEPHVWGHRAPALTQEDANTYQGRVLVRLRRELPYTRGRRLPSGPKIDALRPVTLDVVVEHTNPQGSYSPELSIEAAHRRIFELIDGRLLALGGETRMAVPFQQPPGGEPTAPVLDDRDGLYYSTARYKTLLQSTA